VSPQAIRHSVCYFITSPRSPPGHRLAITEPVPVKFPDGLSRLGVGRSRAARAAVEQTLCRVASSSAPNHINPMLREHLASGTGDLFSLVQPSPIPGPEPPPPSAQRASSPPKLASLSDAELAGLLKDLLGEVQRRTAGRSLRQSRPELERAIREAASILAHLQWKQSGPLRRAVPKTPVVHEAKRKPIRAALLAGVTPTQVAKHFDVPLTFVREVASEAR
jgi:hypothetical protein